MFGCCSTRGGTFCTLGPGAPPSGGVGYPLRPSLTKYFLCLHSNLKSLKLVLELELLFPSVSQLSGRYGGGGDTPLLRGRAFLMVGRLGASHHHVVGGGLTAGAVDFLGVAVAHVHLHHLTREVVGLIVADLLNRLAGVVKLMNCETILL